MLCAGFPGAAWDCPLGQRSSTTYLCDSALTIRMAACSCSSLERHYCSSPIQLQGHVADGVIKVWLGRLLSCLLPSDGWLISSITKCPRLLGSLLSLLLQGQQLTAVRCCMAQGAASGALEPISWCMLAPSHPFRSVYGPLTSYSPNPTGTGWIQSC